MKKYLFYSSFMCLLWPLISGRIITDSESIDRPYNANNYLNLLSKLGTTLNPSENNGSNKNPNSELAGNVRQLRTYLNLYETPSYDCRDSVFQFGIILSQFVECLIVNEMPFSLCLSCSQQYTDLNNAYNDLNNSSRSNCSDSVLKGDKLDLVRDFHSRSLSKWSEGNCDSCFGGKDSNQYLMANNDTKYYFQLAIAYKSCLENQSMANESCVMCRESFDSVNDYYESLTMNYSSYVCNDIIDSMKDIRRQWSESFDCPIETMEASLRFLSIVLVVIVLPFVLYIIGRLFFVGDNNKTLLKQKRLSKYHLESCENEPLIEH